MAAFRTARERRFFVLAAATTLAIFGTAFFAQRLLDPLRSRGMLGGTIWVGLATAAALALVFVVRQRPGPGELLLLALAGVAYALLLRRLTVIQERIHLLEYGLLGGLIWAGLCERWRDLPPRWWRSPVLWAIVLAGGIGWGDEGIQGLIPNRYYDLRDVVLNAKAAALPILVLAGRRWLRARSDAAAAGAAEPTAWR